MGKKRSALATDRRHDDNWRGGYYELAIKLGDHDDVRLGAALGALWGAAGLGSPFRRRSSDAADVSARSLLAGHLHAVAPIPGLGSTLASVILVREETQREGITQLGADWLDLCLPLGALGNLDRRVGAYPFDEGRSSRAWREPVERWFSQVAHAVYAAGGFEYAVAGNEVSGFDKESVRRGWLALYEPGPDGTLAVSRVTDW